MVYGGIIVILGTLIVSSGCGMLSGVDAGGEMEAASLTAEDNGGQVEVNKGQTLVLALESNPTTGFRWEVVGLQQSVLRQQGEAAFKVASELDPPPPGTGGVEVFRFEAIEAGETTLELVYHRPWERDVEPLETFSVVLLVR
jgi:inhibitor of cysteine peptidase